MSSTSTPKIYSFKVDGSIAKGKAVAMGSDKNHVVVGSLNTQRCIGIAQVEATAAERFIEVALPGGGAKALIGETVVAGNDLVSGTDGRLVLPNAAGDEIIARAMEDGVVNDLIAVEVIISSASAAQ